MTSQTWIATRGSSGRVLPRARDDALLLPALVLAIGLWQVGTHVDAWYHFHDGFQIESFVTWSHAILYAGWAVSFALATWRAGGVLDVRERVRRWPPGARLMLVGTALFGIGGVLDAAWHAAFGFEVNLAAFLSPSHDWLLIAALISVVGLLQATLAWRERCAAATRFKGIGDALVIASLALLLRATLWVFSYSDPLAIDYAAGGHQARTLYGHAAIDWANMAAQTAGATGILLQSLIVGLFIAVVQFRLRLASGALASVLLWNGLLTVATTDEWLYLISVGAGALGGEAVRWSIGARRTGARVATWFVAATVPFVQIACAMALAQLFDGGLVWTPHLSVGAPVLAGLFGLTGAMLAVPPAWARAVASSY